MDSRDVAAGGGSREADVIEIDVRGPGSTKDDEAWEQQITDAEAHKTEGNRLYMSGAFEDALDAYERALTTAPDVAALHSDPAPAPAPAPVAVPPPPSHDGDDEEVSDTAVPPTTAEATPASTASEDTPEGTPEAAAAAEDVPSSSDPSVGAMPADTIAQVRKKRLEHYREAREECDLALGYNPTYVKALVRRGKAYWKLDELDAALADMKAAAELTSSPTIDRDVLTLQAEVDARNEKLKAEMLGKLKDLGNTVLGKFGLSLDNFQMQKDPATGNYSVNFTNNPGQS